MVTLGNSAPQDDPLYSPYTLNIRNNNMHLINMKNMHEDGIKDREEQINDFQENRSELEVRS